MKAILSRFGPRIVDFPMALGAFAGSERHHYRPALLLLATLLVALAGQSVGFGKTEVSISAQVVDQIAAFGREKDSWTPVQRKISSKLLLDMKQRLGQPLAAGVPVLQSAVEVDAAGLTLVDIKAEVSDALLRRIEALGGNIINSFAQYNAIRAQVPVAQLELLAAEDSVRSVRPAGKAILHKTNTSQGVVAHRADTARTSFGVNGTGVHVGVLSDSVESLATLQASGDLPAGVTVLSGQAGSGTSEGTAMLEIVYDMAPGASLHFATANGGEAQFAQNILDLRTAGCKVIVDDVSYLAEPVFQDGVVAQAVEMVVAAGVVYLSAAGNEGNLDNGTSSVWEGDFVAMAGTGPLAGKTTHNFGGGVNYNAVVTEADCFTLQWSDAWGAAANDYDLYLLNSTRTSIVDKSIDVQNGSGDPLELIDSSTYLTQGDTLVIVRYSGAGRYLQLNANGGRLSYTTSGQTSGHSAAASAISVAAVDVTTAGGGAFVGGTANPVETYSSDGPRRVFYLANGTAITPGNYSSTGGALRQKPDITAADDVATATSGFNPFAGTSAAAPHAAGIAALVLSLNPSLTPAQVRTVFSSSALDIGTTGVDRDSGAGIVMAYPALFSASGVVYVNRSYTPPPSSDGSPLSPFRTVTEGYQAAQAGNTIRIFSGNYQEAAKLTISKTLLLQATNGTVNISAP